MPTEDTLGQVVSFYSYKGGAGRTMALANVAWILASNGKRVVAIDWDLEAPGLNRYFSPFLIDPELNETKGLIDFLYRYFIAATKPMPGSQADPEWYRNYADLCDYAEPLAWRFPDGGCIDLIPAGQQADRYATRVNRFDWTHFYEKFGGSAFMELAIEGLRKEYDYILIDSRTGVSDTSGICTVHLPDALVVFFTLNNQSMFGASGIIEDVVRQRGEDFPIYPVRARVDLQEKVQVDARRKLSEILFGRYPRHLSTKQRRDYWGSMEVLYVAFYSYFEMLAAVADPVGKKFSVLSAFEYLSNMLTRGEVKQLGAISEEQRNIAYRRYLDDDAKTLIRYQISAPTLAEAEEESWDVYISASLQDRDFADKLFHDLAPYFKVFYAHQTLSPGSRWMEETVRALTRSRATVLLFSHYSKSSKYFQREAQHAISLLAGDSSRVLIPVSLDAQLNIQEVMGGALSPFQWINTSRDSSDYDNAARSILRALLSILVQREENGPIEEKRELLRSQSKLEAELEKKYRSQRKKLHLVNGILAASLGAVLVVLMVAMLEGLADRLLGNFGPSFEDKERAYELSVASYSQAGLDSELSLLLAREAVREAPLEASNTALLRALRRPLLTLDGGDNSAVIAGEWNSLGSYIATLTDRGTIRLWGGDGRLMDEVNMSGASAMRWSPADDRLLVETHSGIVLIWRIEKNTFQDNPMVLNRTTQDPLDFSDYPWTLDEISGQHEVSEYPWSPDGRSVVTVDAIKGTTATVVIWNTEVGRDTKRMATADTRQLEAFMTPDGAFCISGDSKGVVSMWRNEPEWPLYLDLESRLDRPSLSISPNGRFLIVADINREIAFLWDLTTPELTSLIDPSSRSPFGTTVGDKFSWNLAGDKVLTFDQNSCRVFVISDKAPQVALGKDLGDQAFSAATISPQGDMVAFATLSNNELHLQSLLGDAPNGPSFKEHRGRIFCLAFHPDRPRLLSTSYDGSAKLWDVDLMMRIHDYDPSGSNQRQIAASLLEIADRSLKRDFTAKERALYLR